MRQKIIQHFPPKLFVLLKGFGWYGNYDTWQKAQETSSGYDSGNIIQQVKESLLKVKDGEAVYERDSVIFDKIEYSWELLSGLMWVAAQNKGQLNVIDFGGSLGSTYFQNKLLLDKLETVTWNIVEQPSFVEDGINSFQDNILRFFPSIEQCCLLSEKIDVILFSSVLQYLEYPYDILKEAFNHQVEYLIVDRTGFTLNDKERITAQKVPGKIYEATYPCRFFNEKEFVSFFEKNGYVCLLDFNALDQANIPSKYKGFIFRRK